MKRANPLEIFQNKPMTFEGTPLFSFQSVGTEVTVLFERSFNFGCSCCKLACIITTHCRLKKVLHSINLLLAKQQKVAAVETEKIVSSTWRRFTFLVIIVHNVRKKWHGNVTSIFLTSCVITRDFWSTNEITNLELEARLFMKKALLFDTKSFRNFKPKILIRWKTP